MVGLKSFYNQKYIFGIVTTLDEWKICWLADTNKCGVSDFLLENDLSEDDENIYDDRIIYSTRVYKHNEKDLAKIVLSVLVKSYYSPKYPVNLFSNKRNYVYLKEHTWHWVHYKKNEIDNLSNLINFDVPHGNTSNFTILRYFNGGHYSKVRLAISDQGNIVVLKEFLQEDNNIIAEQEKECWKKINGKKVNITTIVNNTTLVMPLVFTIDVNFINKTITIPLDLKVWGIEKNAIPGEFPEILENINIELAKQHIDIKEIAELAIEKCARAGYVHEDFQLWHVAVFPVISNEKIVRLEPVLIDFEHMTKIDDIDEARSVMQNKLKFLLKEYKKYNFQQ